MTAENVCKARGLRGPTEVAKAVNVSPATIHNWYNKQAPQFDAAVDYAVRLRNEQRARDVAAVALAEVENTPALSVASADLHQHTTVVLRVTLPSGEDVSRCVPVDAKNWEFLVRHSVENIIKGCGL